MRVAIVSDIHSNLAALESVVRDIREQRGDADRFWALGDLIGYGPRPNETLDLLRSLDTSAVAGNHDLAAVGREPTDLFHAEAAACCVWNGRQLSDANRQYLLELPQVIREGDVTLVHGSLRDPVWEYLAHAEAVRANFALMATPYLAVGHTHIPMVFEESRNGAAPRAHSPSGTSAPMAASVRAILNPGSVGQPRDGDPRASYAIWDSGRRTISHHRVEYDVGRTQAEMAQAGLPPRMAARLEFGR